jgi:hypothetical protein
MNPSVNPNAPRITMAEHIAKENYDCVLVAKNRMREDDPSVYQVRHLHKLIDEIHAQPDQPDSRVSRSVTQPDFETAPPMDVTDTTIPTAAVEVSSNRTREIDDGAAKPISTPTTHDKKKHRKT